VGFYRFLFTREPLWKIWNAPKPHAPNLELIKRSEVGATEHGPALVAGERLMIEKNRERVTLR
jgi:hypothetical protein